MLELQGAGAKRQGRWLCQGVDLAVHPGELVAVIGPNGAGKSTTLAMLAGDEPLAQGQATLDGASLARLKPKLMARRRAVMLQHATLFFGFEVEEIVAMGLVPFPEHSPSMAQALITQAMQLAGVERLRQRVYMELSGGERQRVQFARAMVQVLASPSEPGRYLLLDEPVASLDLAHAHALMLATRALTQQRIGALVVLHDLNLAARYADRLVVMARGRVVVSGAPQDVLSPRLLREVFGLHAQVLPRGAGDRPLVVALGAALDPVTAPALALDDAEPGAACADRSPDLSADLPPSVAHAS